MKKLLLVGLVGLVVVSSTVEASSWTRSAVGELAESLFDGHLTKKDVAKAGVHAITTAGATPTAVYSAGALGVEATTGTAIASLNGAAAVSATSYAVGAPVASVLGIAAAPAVVGGIIIVGVAGLVAVGINEIFFSDNN